MKARNILCKCLCFTISSYIVKKQKKKPQCFSLHTLNLLSQQPKKMDKYKVLWHVSSAQIEQGSKEKEACLRLQSFLMRHFFFFIYWDCKSPVYSLTVCSPRSRGTRTIHLHIFSHPMIDASELFIIYRKFQVTKPNSWIYTCCF